MIAVSVRHQDQVRLLQILIGSRSANGIAIDHLSILAHHEARVINGMEHDVSRSSDEMIASQYVGPGDLADAIEALWVVSCSGIGVLQQPRTEQGNHRLPRLEIGRSFNPIVLW